MYQKNGEIKNELVRLVNTFKEFARRNISYEKNNVFSNFFASKQNLVTYQHKKIHNIDKIFL